MTSKQPLKSGESNRESDSHALRLLLGFELLLQTSLITILMILNVNVALAFGVCAILFFSCRLAVRVCKSRLQQTTMH